MKTSLSGHVKLVEASRFSGLSAYAKASLGRASPMVDQKGHFL